MPKVFECDKCGATTKRASHLSFYECRDCGDVYCDKCVSYRYPPQEWSENILVNVGKGLWGLMTADNRCPDCWDTDCDYADNEDGKVRKIYSPE